MSSASIERTTKETSIRMTLSLDSADRTIESPLNFLGHMLDAFATHGRFGLTLEATGDVQVDQHHLVEDLGIVLGQCVAQLAGAGGVQRAGFWRMPMDEALADVAIDLCGRATCVQRVALGGRPIGDLDPASLPEFFLGFAREAKCSLHLDLVRAQNDHHAVEAVFKAFGRALRMALEPIGGAAPLSSKGVI